MQLTRRDAVTALAAAGIGVGGLTAVLISDRGQDNEATGAADGIDVDALLPLAEVLYPSEVTITEEFVETYVLGRISNDQEYRDAMDEALEALDTSATERYDRPFGRLTVEQRDSVLRDLGLVSADPVPDGTDVERVRYYLVNELLFAFFTSPTGGELVGAESPTGFPGGLSAYQQGPQP